MIMQLIYFQADSFIKNRKFMLVSPSLLLGKQYYFLLQKNELKLVLMTNIHRKQKIQLMSKKKEFVHVLMMNFQ